MRAGPSINTLPPADRDRPRYFAVVDDEEVTVVETRCDLGETVGWHGDLQIGVRAGLHAAKQVQRPTGRHAPRG
jgi:hypothetical protein